nr:hypothetical protein [Tanacetum cinerariifolium]
MSYDDIRLIFEKNNSNVAFLEKTKEQMEEEDNRALKRKVESSKDKAAKKQKLDEEVEELRKHLQIVPNNDDDVYTEATPLALKVRVVDYDIYIEHNKPYYKIKRADESHQLHLSFLSMLRNFNREDLEVIWKLVKERFAFTKPKNFSDDFLLTTLGAMFEKPDEKEDNVVMRYQALKRKPQTEAQARKNMMIYLRNMARFIMDYFKGMSYDEIRPIFEKNNSNVAFLEKTKEQMEEEDNRALKRKFLICLQ